MVVSALFFIMLVVVDTGCSFSIMDTTEMILGRSIQAMVDSGYFPKCDHISTCTMENMDKLSLWRFDEDNKTTVYGMKDAELLLRDRRFRLNPKITVWIPGFIDDVDDKASQEVLNAYLSKHQSIFFYRTYAYTYSDMNIARSYRRSVKYAPCNGKILADFLCDLFRGGIDIFNIHIIGHSLGGQAAGYVGRHFRKICGRKIPRITALDPAGPCFGGADFGNNQISASDAEFVDIYNCNRNQLGTEYLTGTANFLPNGEGYDQPQCSGFSTSSVCAHYLCVSIWAHSVRGHSCVATNCSSWNSYKSGDCQGYDVQSIGFPCSSRSQGTYYFNTDISARGIYSLSDKFFKIATAHSPEW